MRERKAADRSVRSTFLPPVSILKPLKGTDPEMYQSFRSHCMQDYPKYEIIFGVSSDASDPAIESVRRLQSEFADRKILWVVCPDMLGGNVKVSNLAQMLDAASYDHLIVNDSDIRVAPDYLRRVMAPLQDSRVGLVTCLYRGAAAPTLGSRLEALGISTDFCAGVLAARTLEGVHFGLGSTLAFRRVDLRKIGGFASFADYLADDYELGKRLSELGLTVQLSEVVVETFLPAYKLRDFIAHQLRWARGVRDSRLGGYLGLAFTFGVTWAALALIVSRAPWVWVAAAATVLLRLAVALSVGRAVLMDRQVLKDLWLIPLRDLVCVGVWKVSFFGNTIRWRGDRFRLKDGKPIRLSP